MQLKPGLKLASAVSPAQFVVIRGAGEIALTHGGVAVGTEAPAEVAADGLAGEVLVGKRYSDESGDLELLCVKPGAGVLAADGVELTVKAAKALPASD
ncbi:hypothetical protein QNO21_09220 [Microbacterium sp. zg-Y818]|uniref:hypothetical protein n=1 Tax=unclassified Microbacterium TaxID=2609290 RepID=UPI00214C8500|nr:MULTISPECIES: hypothetical protein [unclassified Microbacterium]MCR2799302.1 hypothetical protein [Microbacterium sp. zg.Y818]WIM21303.1 hypothetical protein QNO21_09220 [Microbacterium sp. zg-Y818]